MHKSKDEEIYEVFDNIADKYDLANDIFTFRQHRVWKDQVLEYSELHENCNYLDIATGTGDLAIYAKNKYKFDFNIYATDINENMLKVFHNKNNTQKLNIDIKTADARELPYEDNFFDSVTIAYGIRNIPNPEICLKDIHRVLKNNGVLVILETGVPSGIVKFPYNFYVRNIVPLLGQIITKKKWAYEYLNRSAHIFPYGFQFKELTEKSAKYKTEIVEKKLFGASYIYKFRAVK